MMSDTGFTFADAASIVQSQQKDQQIETLLIQKINNILQAVKGQLFVNLYPKQIATVAKLIYLLLTIYKNERTLGQEYVDLMFIDKNGKTLTKRGQRLGYALSLCFGPYLAMGIFKKLRRWMGQGGDNDEEEDNTSQRLSKLMDLGLNLHLMMFYFKGTYYDIWKRLFGLRYMITHRVDDNERRFRENNTKTYKMLGYILLFQTLTQGIPLIKNQVQTIMKSPRQNTRGHGSHASISSLVLTKVPEKTEIKHVTLEDPDVLPFIPKQSRNCTLCLSPMTDPSCSPCGHIYCWDCLMNWCNERPECPLCRQKCHPQQIQPLI